MTADEHHHEADGKARAAAEEAQKANEAKGEAERCLKECIQPILTPSLEEVVAAKRHIQYKEDRFHFAVAGTPGSGKSSLVNALRGLRNRDAGATDVAIAKHRTTRRYPDGNPERPFVWHEISGAGVVKLHGWQYFTDQGLYVFDSIVLLFDHRFTMMDIAVLANARRFNISTYIVRSKADCHIRYIMSDIGYDSDEDIEDVERRNMLYDAARKQFIEETRKSVRTSLEDANLPDQRVYIVSSNALLSIIRNKIPKKTIDEVELLDDLFTQAYAGCGRMR